jgi:hypothetical protein
MNGHLHATLIIAEVVAIFGLIAALISLAFYGITQWNTALVFFGAVVAASGTIQRRLANGS